MQHLPRPFNSTAVHRRPRVVGLPRASARARRAARFRFQCRNGARVDRARGRARRAPCGAASRAHARRFRVPFRKQQVSSRRPANSGPTASRVRASRTFAASTASAKTMPSFPPRRACSTGAVQFAVILGVSPARVKSARSRSPASSCPGRMNGRPSRSFRRASQKSGLSASLKCVAPKSSRLARDGG